MKFYKSIILLSLILFTTFSYGKNRCACLPLPTTKTYIGDARQKHWIGYSIHWKCGYQCAPDVNSSEEMTISVEATYKQYYLRQENGLEGICEGMTYKPQYNYFLNRYIYLYSGKNFYFNPSDSNSEALKAWALAHNCE